MTCIYNRVKGIERRSEKGEAAAELPGEGGKKKG
jgi:hypothetical protein